FRPFNWHRSSLGPNEWRLPFPEGQISAGQRLFRRTVCALAAVLLVYITCGCLCTSPVGSHLASTCQTLFRLIRASSFSKVCWDIRVVLSWRSVWDLACRSVHEQ